MAAPSVPTTFLVQASDQRVALTWDQMPSANEYQIEVSLDNVTFSLLATITGSPLENFFTHENAENSFQAQLTVSSTTFLVGQAYVITALGSTSTAEWNTLGVPSGVVPNVGLMFIAAQTSGTGSGTVQLGLTTGRQYFYQVQAVNGSGSSGYTSSQGVIVCAPGEECLGNLRLYAQQRADMVNSQFVTTSEWNQMITKSYKRLYDILIQKYGDDYYMATPYCFVTSGNNQLYPFPDGVNWVSYLSETPTPSPAFYKLMLVEVSLNINDPNAWITIRKYQRVQQNLWNYPNVYTFRGITNLRYRPTGNGLYLVPSTQSGQFVRIWYAPRPSSLLLDTDLIDGISGWEEYVILDAAIKALKKQEQDTSDLQNELNMVVQRIEEAAENRDVGEPETVSDSKMRNLAWTDDSGYGPGSGFFA